MITGQSFFARLQRADAVGVHFLQALRSKALAPGYLLSRLRRAERKSLNLLLVCGSTALRLCASARKNRKPLR
jgi:hypothetical protein